MTIDTLIEELEYLKDICKDGGLTEIRFAQQPSWPFEYSISNVIAMTQQMREDSARAEMREEGMTEEEINENIDFDEINGTEDVVYLVEGSQLGYLPGEVKEEIGW
jgi:hypothetical protein